MIGFYRIDLRFAEGVRSAMLCLELAALCGCFKKRMPDRYLFPDGSRGRVRIGYRVKGATPLPIEDGHYLIAIDGSGRARTSSSIESGIAKDELGWMVQSAARPFAVRATLLAPQSYALPPARDFGAPFTGHRSSLRYSASSPFIRSGGRRIYSC